MHKFAEIVNGFQIQMILFKSKGLDTKDRDPGPLKPWDHLEILSISKRLLILS